MPPPLRFAIVGLDHWYSALPLAEELAAHPDAELLLIADMRIARARAIGERLGVPATDDLQAAVEQPAIDVVASFASSDRNPEICIRAAQAGKRILSVKPVARHVTDARRVVSAVETAGVAFVPAESRSRVSPLGRHLAALVEQRPRGRLVSAHFTVSGHPPASWPGAADSGWWTDPRRTAGGAWIDHAIYDVDRMRSLLGSEPIAVSARMANLVHRGLDVEDFGHAVFEFADGTVASMEHTWTAAAGAGRISATFAFEGGTTVIDSITETLATSASPGADPGWSIAPAPSDVAPLESLLANLRGEEHTLGTVNDALANLLACESAYRASAEGSTIAILAGG